MRSSPLMKMTGDRHPRLVLRADTDTQAGVIDGLRSSAPETFVHEAAAFRDPAAGEEFYDSTSSSEVGPLMEDPDTPTKTSTHQLDELRDESTTTIAQNGSSSSPAQFESSPLPPCPNLSRMRSSPSLRTGSELRALRDEHAQEEARVAYLQGVGLGLACTRRSADLEPPSSKTLPPGSEPPEGLVESSPSRRSGSLRGSSSRSASLRLRNERLPPAYAQPHEQSLLAGSAYVPDRQVVGETILTGRRLSSLPLLDASSERQTTAPLIPDPDEKAIPAPLTVHRRPPPDLTNDITMSGALSGSGVASSRESRSNEVMKDVDGGKRPDLPLKSPDRPSGRNSALLSSRESAVVPVPEPLPEQETPVSKPRTKKAEKTSWVVISALAALWAVAFALTVFGVSRISPLDRQPAACTLEQVQTCTPPSLSFVHNFRLNATLPKALQSYLPLIQPNGIQDLTFIDLGLEVQVQNDAVPLYVRGGMSMGTVFPDDKANLLSNLTYYGVLDGTGDAKEVKRRLRYMM